MALSGGKTPGTLHAILASSPYTELIDWQKTHLFWGDERWLPARDPESNFAMAKATLLDHIDIPATNIHPMPVHLSDPATGAREYERSLKQFFSAEQRDSFPVFDLILLGMGPDGHIASLFPGHPALALTGQWVTDVTSPHASPQVPRLTLTLPVINHARHVIFLVSGEKKKEIMLKITTDLTDVNTYPAARVRPESGETTWYFSD